jgi:hypothetical protein
MYSQRFSEILIMPMIEYECRNAQFALRLVALSLVSTNTVMLHLCCVNAGVV